MANDSIVLDSVGAPKDVIPEVIPRRPRLGMAHLVEDQARFTALES